MEQKQTIITNEELLPSAHHHAKPMLSAGWISVKDRLPETNLRVLVTKTNGEVFLMSYHAPFNSTERVFQWWGFGKWVYQHSQVTHWMPLPSPPSCR